MSNVEMFLDDADKRVLIGLPPTSMAPPKVNNLFYHATELEKSQNPQDRKQAERIFLELLNGDFDNVVVQAALGMHYAMQERNGLAHLLLSRARENLPQMMDSFKRIGIVPKTQQPEHLAQFFNLKKSEILNAIGTCFKHENKTEEARKWFTQAQDGVPLNPDIQNNLGTLYINEGDPTKAQEHLEAALSVDPNHAQAHWNRSLTYLELGDYARGWPEYDWGLKAHVRAERNYTKEPLPWWDGIPGKRLVVYGEQGIGDEILFASMLPDLLKVCPEVVFDCHKKLHTLFANSFPGIPIYPTREDEMLTWPMLADGKTLRHPMDAKVAIGSLGRYFRNKLEDFPGTPYLQPTPAAEVKWADRLAELGSKPKVGISWIGGHKKTRIEVRSIDLERWLPILKDRDVDFISLQYTPCEDELKAFSEKHGITIHHWPEACYSANYDDTAGLVANLDLVITVATSVIHLAGAMGVPCWCLTASRAAWREYYCPDSKMPWYSSVTIFKQDAGTTEWQPVIDEVATTFTDLLSGVNHG